MPNYGERKKGFSPTLKKRYYEEITLYPNAESETLLYQKEQMGTYQVNLKRTALLALLGGMTVLFILWRKT